MKGMVDTKIILQAILDKDRGLRHDKVLSHVAVMFTERYHKMFLIADSAININPNLEKKKYILENTVSFANKLGVKNPKCAVICAKEKTEEAMPHTIEAAELTKMNKEGLIKNCIVEGPFGFDNAVSKEAAKIKKIESEVAGDFDILLVPDIESGNILYKSITFLSNSESAGIVLGAKAKVILPSRADNEINKFNSIILGAFYLDCEVRDDYFGD